MVGSHDLALLLTAARAAAQTLRLWVVDRYELDPHQLDVALIRSLAQYDQVARLNRFCGYDVSEAPHLLRHPMQAYMAALRGGHEPRSLMPLPKALIAAHEQAARGSDGRTPRWGADREEPL